MKIIFKPMKYLHLSCVNIINRSLDAIVYDDDFIVKIFYEGGGRSYIAEHNGKIIGYILCNANWVVSFALYREYHGKGIGKRLLCNALMAFSKLNKEGQSLSLKLHVNTNNNNAVELYKKVGFNIESEVLDYYGENINAYRMLWNPSVFDVVKKYNCK